MLSFKHFFVVLLALPLISGCNGPKYHIVTFDTNGGTAIEPLTVKHGAKIERPSDPLYDGHHFKKWMYQDEEWLFDTNKVLKDITLSAVWLNNTYNVYQRNGDQKSMTKVEYDCPYYLGTSSKNGFEFDGWYTDEYCQGTKLTNSAGSSLENYKFLDDVTVYAGFTYKVTFISNGGSPVETLTLKENEGIPEGVVSKKEGMTFDGWLYEGRKVEYNTPLNGNSTVYAKWKEETENEYFSYRTFEDGTATITGFSYLVSSILEQPFVIPSHIYGAAVTSIGKNAFKSNNFLRSIVLPKTIVSIGDSAFESCTTLISIVIPDSVTTIGSSAFKDCTSLGTAIIGNGVTSINDSTFRNCNSLYSLTLGNGVTSINDSAFYHCYSLIEIINKSSLNIVAKSSSYGYIAYFAEQVIANESQSNIVFDKDDFVKYIDTSNVILVDYLGDKNTIVISDEITSIGSFAFAYCEHLYSVVVGDGVTSIGHYAFKNCYSLFSIKIGKNVNSLGADCFESCLRLAEIINKSKLNISKETYDPWTVTTGDAESKIVFGKDGLVTYEDASNINLVAYLGDNLLIRLPSNIDFINDYAFYFCSRELKIIMPEGIRCVGGTPFVIDEHRSITPFSLSTEYYAIGKYGWITAYFYSYSMPIGETSCKYWHYVDEIPTPW